MTAGMVGADVEALEAAGDRLRRNGELIRAIYPQVRSAIGNTPWEGDDGGAFSHDWDGPHRARLDAAATELVAMGDELIRQAAEQRRVSGEQGATSGLVAGAALAGVKLGAASSGERIPAGAHASTSDYLAEIDRLEPGEIGLRLVSAGPPERYVLLLRGLEVTSLGNNSVMSTVGDWLGTPSAYQARIQALLDGLPGDAQVGIIGHSQGGLAALNVALWDHRVTDVLTLGSPVDHRLVRPGLNTLSIVNRHDPIPAIDRDLSIYLPPLLGTILLPDAPELTFGHADSRPLDVGFNHGIADSYRPVVQHLEGGVCSPLTIGSGEQEGVSWLSDFESTYGGGPSSGAAQVPDAPMPPDPPWWVPLRLFAA